VTNDLLKVKKGLAIQKKSWLDISWALLQGHPVYQSAISREGQYPFPVNALVFFRLSLWHH
ncbi:MAG: hypothetical protein ACK559_27275, partial [bacterium]